MLSVSSALQNAHIASLQAPRRTVSARVTYRDKLLRMDLQTIQEPEQTDASTRDIGRTAVRDVGGVTKGLRVAHVSDGFNVTYWANGFINDTITPLVLQGGTPELHSSGAYLDAAGMGYMTRAYAGTLDLYKVSASYAASIHRSLALPVTVAANEWSSVALVSDTAFFFCYVQPGVMRIWLVEFPTTLWQGTATWTEMPFSVLPTHDQAKFLATAMDQDGTDRRFTRLAANGFDAVKVSGYEFDYVVIYQDHQLGRTQAVRVYPGGAWSDPSPLIPLDFVDEGSRAHLCRLSYSEDTFYASGRVYRYGSDNAPHGFDCIMRSRDGWVWSMEEDSFVTRSQQWGTVVRDPNLPNYYYISRTGRWKAPAETVEVLTPFYMSAQYGTDSIPYCEFDMPTTTLPTPQRGQHVLLEMGYDNTLLPVGEFSIDRIGRAQKVGALSRTVTARDWNGKRLNSYALPHTVDRWTQTRKWADLKKLGPYYTQLGGPRVASYTCTLAAAYNGEAQIHIRATETISNPCAPGDVLKLYASKTVVQRVKITGARDESQSEAVYPCVRLQGSGVIAAGTELFANDVGLGQINEVDAIVAVLPRAVAAQSGVAAWRFSGKEHYYNEAAVVRTRYQDASNHYYLRLQKEDGAVGWTIGLIAEGNNVVMSNGLIAVNPIDLVLYTRWRFQNGVSQWWYSLDALTWTLLGSHVEQTYALPDEGKLCFAGIANPVAATTSAVANQLEGGRWTFEVALSAPATSFPPTGFVKLGETVAEYEHRTTRAEAQIQMEYYGADGYWHTNGDLSGFEHCLVKMELFGPQWPPAPSWGTVTDIAASGEGYNWMVNIQPNPQPEWYWNYGRDDLLPNNSDIPPGTTVLFTFYPVLRLTGDTGIDWAALPAGTSLALAADPDGEQPQIALDGFTVADAMPDISVAEAVQQSAALFGVPVETDKIAPSRWAASASWPRFVGDQGEIAFAPNAAGTYYSGLYLYDGVFSCILVGGQGSVGFQVGGTLWEVRIAGSIIEWRRAGALRASWPLHQGISAGTEVELRLSVQQEHIAVWVDGVFCAHFISEEFPEALKEIVLIATTSTILTVSLPEAYDNAELGLLVDSGDTARSAIDRQIGSRRFQLLYRANRPPRLMLEQREGPHSLHAAEIVRQHDLDDEPIRTVVRVTGAYHIAEAIAEDAPVEGLRFLDVSLPDIYSLDACQVEATALLRMLRERASTAQISSRPNLLVEVADEVVAHAAGTPEIWIAEGVEVSYELTGESVDVKQKISARKKIV